jgi:hypothetical protein
MKVLVAATLCGLAIGAVACNDDDGDTRSADSYFAELDRITRDADERLNAIPTPDVDDDSSLEDAQDAFADFYRELRELTEDVFNDIAGLDPPQELADAHDRYTDEIEELLAAADDFADDIQNADSLEELGEAVTNTEAGDEISARVEEACVALQDFADEHDIGITLSCAGE